MRRDHHVCPRLCILSSAADRRTGSAARVARDVRLARTRRCWRSDDLRSEREGDAAARRKLCRSHTQRREALRSTGRAADQVRIGHQPEGRKGARHHNAADRHGSRRHGDRIGLGLEKGRLNGPKRRNCQNLVRKRTALREMIRCVFCAMMQPVRPGNAVPSGVWGILLMRPWWWACALAAVLTCSGTYLLFDRSLTPDRPLGAIDAPAPLSLMESPDQPLAYKDQA